MQLGSSSDPFPGKSLDCLLLPILQVSTISDEEEDGSRHQSKGMREKEGSR